jgi:hypothetical protein
MNYTYIKDNNTSGPFNPRVHMKLNSRSHDPLKLKSWSRRDHMSDPRDQMRDPLKLKSWSRRDQMSDLFDKVPLNNFNLYDRTPLRHDDTFYSHLTKSTGGTSVSAISKCFFNTKNVEELQRLIIRGVYTKTNRRMEFEPRNVYKLRTIMKRVIGENSRCVSVKQLNKLVVDFATQHFINEHVGYQKYLMEISTTAIPIQHARSTYAPNTLILKPWF